MGAKANRNRNGSLYPKGIFIQNAKIKAIEDVSQQTTETRSFSHDVAIELTLAVPTQNNGDIEKKLYIGGNLKYDGDKVVGLGGAFKIDRVLEAAGLPELELNDDNSLPLADIMKLEGKEITILSYVRKLSNSGKPIYNIYDKVAKANQSKALLEEFQKDEYAFKYYDPSLLDAVETQKEKDVEQEEETPPAKKATRTAAKSAEKKVTKGANIAPPPDDDEYEI